MSPSLTSLLTPFPRWACRAPAVTLVLLALAGSIGLGGTAHAQTAPPKPTKPTKPVKAPTVPAAAAAAASSAAGERVLSAGAGVSAPTGGGMLTRDELRVCLKQEADVRQRLEAQQAARVPLDKDKETLAAEQAALRAERASLQAPEPGVVAINERTSAYATKVAEWNVRLKAFEDNPPRSGPAQDRERDLISAERAAIEKERDALELERERLRLVLEKRNETSRAFNERVKALEVRITASNKRIGEWADVTEAVEIDRKAWVASCSNRRYREIDEDAIKAGR
jgi:hypothetical protein